jgi:hypothetical protein
LRVQDNLELYLKLLNVIIMQDINTNSNSNDHGQNNEHDNNGHNKLIIFINGIKYDENDGVKSQMKGEELAALVPIPANDADITEKNSSVKIQPSDLVSIKNGDHFEIIRKSVIAGFDGNK